MLPAQLEPHGTGYFGSEGMSCDHGSKFDIKSNLFNQSLHMLIHKSYKVLIGLVPASGAFKSVN